jgi:ABC-2 type transport system ATP-binding protein
MSDMAQPALVVRGLSKAYDRVPAVRDVGFAVAAGEIFGLLGPNGAGKTTIIESIAGLNTPDQGQVLICGLDAKEEARAARRRMGVTLQSTNLQDKLTPREALDLFAALQNVPGNSGSVLDRFGLTAKKDALIATLSGGQVQRLALALAFLHHPDLLLLDEPTAGLDPLARREFHDHIRALKKEGRAVLLSSHDMEEVESLCDRVAVLNEGQIVADGAPARLIAASRRPILVTVQTDTPLEAAWLDYLPAIQNLVCEAGGARFSTADLNAALADLLMRLRSRGIGLLAVRASKASLEEVIVDLTGSRH